MPAPSSSPEMLQYYYSEDAVLAPPYAPFIGFAGIFAATVFSTIGAAYGTVRSGIAIAGIGQFKPEVVMKALIPVVMSGILAVYGLVIAVLIAQDIGPPPDKTYTLFAAFMHLGAGLAVGLCGLSAGYAIGAVGESGVRGLMSQPRLYVGLVLILIFSEVLGLYGLIVALIMNTKAQG